MVKQCGHGECTKIPIPGVPAGRNHAEFCAKHKQARIDGGHSQSGVRRPRLHDAPVIRSTRHVEGGFFLSACKGGDDINVHSREEVMRSRWLYVRLILLILGTRRVRRCGGRRVYFSAGEAGTITKTGEFCAQQKEEVMVNARKYTCGHSTCAKKPVHIPALPTPGRRSSALRTPNPSSFMCGMPRKKWCPSAAKSAGTRIAPLPRRTG